MFDTQLAKIEEMRGEYHNALQGHETARSALAEAEAVIPPLVAQRESLIAEFQQASFEEDDARVREISNKRKQLDKDIASAQKSY